MIEAYLYCHSKADEDIASDVFLHALEINNFDHAYLLTEIKRKISKILIPEPCTIKGARFYDPDLSDFILDPFFNPQHFQEYRELLDQKMFNIIHLHFVEGKTFDEIGTILGIKSRQLVHHHYQKALDLIRNELSNLSNSDRPLQPREGRQDDPTLSGMSNRKPRFRRILRQTKERHFRSHPQRHPQD